MKTTDVFKLLSVVLIGALPNSPLVAAPVGSAFSYQGRLGSGGGPVPDGLYDLQFALYDAAAAGSPLGSAVTLNALPVSNGAFTAQLDFGAAPFASGEARWLEIAVNTNGVAPLVTLTPRQRLSPTPQAIYAGNAATANGVAAGSVTSAGLATSSVNSGAIVDGTVVASDLSSGLLNNTFWKLGGNGALPPGLNFLGTLGFTPLELRANNQPVLRLQPNATSPNLLGGHPANGLSGIVSGAFIGGGGATDRSNTVSGSFAAIVGGESHRASGDWAFIGGGAGHTNSGLLAMVGGGAGHYVSGFYAGISAGASNQNHGDYAFIGGGAGNFVTLNSYAATVGGGVGNDIVQSPEATIGGGHENRIADSADAAVISGGYFNLIRDNGLSGAIGGGVFNLVTSAYATVGGGVRNAAQNLGATIAGGSYNTNSGMHAVIGGGVSNRTSGTFSTVAGGQENRVTGSDGVIPGGFRNEATNGALASGSQAIARHRGSWVWADNAAGFDLSGSYSGGPFASTGTNQFLIRAGGGVGVNTNNPQATLHVQGNIATDALRAPGAGVNTGTFAFTHRTSATSVTLNISIIDHPLCNADPNAILVITHNWSADTAVNRYNTEPVGVYFTAGRWRIFHENSAVAMPVGRAFNVLVIKP